MAEPLYMTVKDYASRLSASISTVRDMCRNGKLPAIKIGTGWRINVFMADKVLADNIAERMKPKPREVIAKHRQKYATSDNSYREQLRVMQRRVWRQGEKK